MCVLDNLCFRLHSASQNGDPVEGAVCTGTDGSPKQLCFARAHGLVATTRIPLVHDNSINQQCKYANEFKENSAVVAITSGYRIDDSGSDTMSNMRFWVDFRFHDFIY